MMATLRYAVWRVSLKVLDTLTASERLNAS